MQLSTADCRLFYKLHPALMWYANRQLRVLAQQPEDPVEFCALEPELRLKVRDAVHAQPALIDRFMAENPLGFDSDELTIVSGWKHALVGSYYVTRYLKKYTVFLSSEPVPKAYGVLGLAEPPEDLIGPHLPRLVSTVLLPFAGRIVYDGLLSEYDIIFGGGIKRALASDYRRAKQSGGIITALPVGDELPKAKAASPTDDVGMRARPSVVGRTPEQIPASRRLYQFKITLRNIELPIWRRIQVKDCSLDRLHEHIQTAMGWTNSHLHQFVIDGAIHGDPELLLEGFEDDPVVIDSRRTRLNRIMPRDGSRFSFTYEYDFGDCWEHDVLFEGCLAAEKGARYPLCLEGARACPPEDVGGPSGYQDYLATLNNPNHEEWEEISAWRGPFRPEEFDAAAATNRMRRGLPDWRKEALW